MTGRSILACLVVLALFSCKSEYKFVLNAPKKIQANEELTISLSESKDKPFDSVHFSIDDQKIIAQNNQATIKISDYKLGKHTLTALVFYENKTEKVTKPIYFMASTPPVIYTYEIINTYPHARDAYTQGLEYHDGFLYEGTGRNGTSYLRKVELETGEILKQVDLDDAYFGEGITIFNDKIYQLTWKAGKGFIYDLDSFEQLGEFNYLKSREGWGLTHTEDKIIKSEGTERIWFLDPETMKEETYIEAYTNKQKVEELNELEYVNGKIYANKWQKNSIIIINPATGHVEGVADLISLQRRIAREQELNSDDVLNGIAYDAENDRLFVTGKHWSKLYEIVLKEK